MIFQVLTESNKPIDLILAQEKGKDGSLEIAMSSKSWLIRQFIPEIKFVFEKNKVAKVAKYIGPSAFSIDGKKPKTIIDFEYK